MYGRGRPALAQTLESPRKVKPRQLPAPRHTLIDVLDRVLSKGIVIIYEVDVSVAGLRVIEIDGHTMIMSLDTYLHMTEPQAADTENSPALLSATEEYLRDLPTGAAPHLMA